MSPLEFKLSIGCPLDSRFKFHTSCMTVLDLCFFNGRMCSPELKISSCRCLQLYRDSVHVFRVQHILGCSLSSGRSYAQELELRSSGIYVLLCYLIICSKASFKNKLNCGRKGASEWKLSG